MEADGFVKIDPSGHPVDGPNLWLKSTSKGKRYVRLAASNSKFYPHLLLEDGTLYSLGGRATFAGVLDAFLKFNIEKQRTDASTGSSC